ncbi:MAG: hypothetical protein ABI861_01995 [Panacibacter sp.]
MTILQIEHKVPNFEGWKQAFNNDPLNRKKSGTRRHRIYRMADDPNYVIIDLEFDSIEEAEAMLAALEKLWNKVEGTVMLAPKARLLNMVESVEY